MEMQVCVANGDIIPNQMILMSKFYYLNLNRIIIFIIIILFYFDLQYHVLFSVLQLSGEKIRRNK